MILRKIVMLDLRDTQTITFWNIRYSTLIILEFSFNYLLHILDVYVRSKFNSVMIL